MKKLILTTLSDAQIPDFSSRPEVDVFLQSASRLPDTDLVILSDRLNRQLPHVACPSSPNIVLDRWIYFYQFLCTAAYSHVLLADSRDIYFQSDPFAYASEKVLLASEGLTHAESKWNQTDQEHFQESLGISFDSRAWPVVNGGVVLGPIDKVRAYCLLVFMTSRKSVTQTDQAAINLLWNTALKYDPDYSLSSPKKDSFCATGESIKIGDLPFQTRFEKGTLRTSENKPYAIFHQWERTIYREEILRNNRFV